MSTRARTISSHAGAPTLLCVLFLTPRVLGDCYVANTTSFEWCNGYAELGYNCSADGASCASDQALGQSYFCALHYPTAVLDALSGQCCDAPQDGQCRNPRSGTVVSFDYGPADHKPGLIMEGCAQYEHGPTCYNADTAPHGDKGWEANYPSEDTPGGCPPLPAHFDETKVHVAKMSTNFGPDYHGCYISCDPKQVTASGGVDPCSAGDFYSVSSGHNAMKCYSGNFKAGGICSYNCTLSSGGTLACSDSLL